MTKRNGGGGRWPASRIALITFQAVFVVILWGGSVGKAVSDSFSDFITFLTNWTFVINLIFYTLDIAFGYVFVRFFATFSAVGIWIVAAMNWTVFWLFEQLYQCAQL